ncbi:Dehydrogenases with different specificities (related to short-chain alcohol dehydrogenases) [Ceraceosorus bombacis]|uniref:Dehydrogenases with different specificities (Related to short-chain alcohol dehydrogenases) n=1 Tax=Ceraceosorus bombacis TaxID=401625 RepID=A0A0P1BPS4_9BASI|nr:Dehydrogenases with different specificities (related to short-chain alcohol dehydrogenases) [Ceraceosorus bombacis]
MDTPYVRSPMATERALDLERSTSPHLEKTALITGSTDPKALGFTAALVLAKAHNFNVILSGRKKPAVDEAVQLLRTKLSENAATGRYSCRVEGLVLDVTSAESIKNALAVLHSSDGPLGGDPLDVLINNAGVGAPPGLAGKGTTTMFLATEDTRAVDVATVMNTNVGAVVEVTSEKFNDARVQGCLTADIASYTVLEDALIPFLSRSDAPRIVNVGSARGSNSFASGLPAQRTGALVYNASKAALNMVTIMQAKNLPAVVKPNLKVNAAAPGHVSTPFNSFTGNRTLEAGAGVYVHLATLPEDGPTGQLIGDHAPFSSDGHFVQLPCQGEMLNEMENSISDYIAGRHRAY